MPWSKIKNIILAILAVTNLALLVLVGGQTIQDRRLLSQAREDAIQFLRGRGVEVDESIIPQSMELKPQIVERDLAGEERAAAALRGAREALEGGLTPDAVLSDAERALSALGELTGRTLREDLTARIFERFCVGK